MTNLKECIAAWQALRALAAQTMDYKSAHALVLLKERLRPHVAYFSSTEMDLVKKYAELDAEGNPVYEAPGARALPQCQGSRGLHSRAHGARRR